MIAPYLSSTSRYDRWSSAAIADVLRKTMAEVSVTEQQPGWFLARVVRALQLHGLIRQKGGDTREFDVDVSVIDRQLDLIQQQLNVAREMLRGVVSPGPQPVAASDRRVVHMDPLVAFTAEMAKQVAMGRNWDSGYDQIDQVLVLAATRQFAEGPGRGHGRRSVEGLRQYVMSRIPQPGGAAA